MTGERIKYMFERRKSSRTGEKEHNYDKSTEKPVLRCSICTGEQVAGFQDLKTGVFHEVCLIRNEKELEDFKNDYGLDFIEKIY